MQVLLYCPRHPALAKSLAAQLVLENMRVHDIQSDSLACKESEDIPFLLKELKKTDEEFWRDYLLLTTAAHSRTQSYDECVETLRHVRAECSELRTVVFTDDDPVAEALLLSSGAQYCVGSPRLAPSTRAPLLRASLLRVMNSVADDAHTKRHETLRFGTLVFETAHLRISNHRTGAEERLRPREARLLETLIRRPERAFSRESLVMLMHGPDARPLLRCVDVYAKEVRAKLRKLAGTDPERREDAWKCIKTVRNRGYAFSATMALQAFPAVAAERLTTAA